jgi:hypothetical protein
MADRVHIGELRICVPGLTQSAARSLAERVAAEIASGVAEKRPGPTLAAIHIRARIPAGANEWQLPREIARAILRSLP